MGYGGHALQEASSSEPPPVPRSTHITRQFVPTSPHDADNTGWVRCAGHCTNCSSCRPKRCVPHCIVLNSVDWLAYPWPLSNPVNILARRTRKPIHLQRRAEWRTASAWRTSRRASLCRTSCIWWRRSGEHPHAHAAAGVVTHSLNTLALVCVRDGCCVLTVRLPFPCQMDARRAVPRAVRRLSSRHLRRGARLSLSLSPSQSYLLTADLSPSSPRV